MTSFSQGLCKFHVIRLIMVLCMTTSNVGYWFDEKTEDIKQVTVQLRGMF